MNYNTGTGVAPDDFHLKQMDFKAFLVTFITFFFWAAAIHL